jgi:conserved domain protein
VSDGSILFGVAETDISVMHLPDESPYPVSRDECIVPVHTVVLPDDGSLLH